MVLHAKAGESSSINFRMLQFQTGKLYVQLCINEARQGCYWTHKEFNVKCSLKSNYVNSMEGLNSLFEHPTDA